MSSETYENDNKVVKALETFGNIFALNVFYILFSVPIVTIGASTTALYSMMLKMIDKKESAIWKGFVKAFKSNFKKATKIWLIILVAIAIIAAEIGFVIKFDGVVVSFYTVLVVVEVFLIIFTLPFLFPLTARYENTVWNTLKNAFLLTVSNFWSALKIILGWGMPIILSVYYPITFLYTWWAWLIFVFGLIAFCTSYTLRKVFRKIETVQTDNAEKKAEDEAKRAEKDEKKRKQASNKNYHRSHREIMKEMAEQNKKLMEEGNSDKQDEEENNS